MSRYYPALLGGLFIGVLSALPVVSTANLCCCLWVVVGGALTTYLLQQARPNPVESSEAALFGLIAGLIGGVLYVAVTAVILSGPIGAYYLDQVREQLNNDPRFPADVRDQITAIMGSGALALIVAAVTIPTYAAFSLIGALIGLAIFKKKVPPPAAPPPGPTFTP